MINCKCIYQFVSKVTTIKIVCYPFCDGSLSKVEKSLNLKSKFPYRFTYKVYLFGGMFMGDEEEMKSWPGFPGSISLFHVT